MMVNLLILFSAGLPLALAIALWVLAQISRRYGEVTHRPPYYRWLYGSMALAVVALVVRLLALSTGDADPAGTEESLPALLHDGALLLGLAIALIVAWRYWGWLVYARDGQAPVAPKNKKPHDSPT